MIKNTLRTVKKIKCFTRGRKHKAKTDKNPKFKTGMFLATTDQTANVLHFRALFLRQVFKYLLIKLVIKANNC